MTSRRLNREERRGHIVNETIRKIQEDIDTAGPAIPQSLLTARGDIIFRNATTAARLPAGVSGQYLQTKGVADPVWATAWQVISKTADESLATNTVFQDDDALTFAVAAATKYRFRGEISYTTPAAADFKLQFTGPASPTLILYAADDYVNVNGAYANAFGVPIVFLFAGTTQFQVRFSGILQNGANAGSVTLQWAQNASSGTTTVYAGSYLEFSSL